MTSYLDRRCFTKNVGFECLLPQSTAFSPYPSSLQPLHLPFVTGQQTTWQFSSDLCLTQNQTSSPAPLLKPDQNMYTPKSDAVQKLFSSLKAAVRRDATKLKRHLPYQAPHNNRREKLLRKDSRSSQISRDFTPTLLDLVKLSLKLNCVTARESDKIKRLSSRTEVEDVKECTFTQLCESHSVWLQTLKRRMLWGCERSQSTNLLGDFCILSMLSLLDVYELMNIVCN